MNGDNVNTTNAERFERWLQFVFRDGEIAIDDGVIVRAGKSDPCIHAHVLVDLDAMHGRGLADRELHHAVVRFTARAENGVEWFSRDRALLRQWISAERVFRLRI